MAVTLDPILEQRIQRVVESGAFREPAELLSHALDLIEAEQHAGDWLFRNREGINAALEESFAAKARGESYTPEESHAMLAERRAARASHAA